MGAAVYRIDVVDIRVDVLAELSLTSGATSNGDIGNLNPGLHKNILGISAARPAFLSQHVLEHGRSLQL